MNLILASTSPRRRELLRTFHLPFEVVAPAYAEVGTNLPPRKEALYHAEQKVRSVACDHPEALILGSDTLVAYAGEKLGKPKDKADAVRMLNKLSGKIHRIFSAVVLLDTSTQSFRHHVEEVVVTFHPLSKKQIEDYVATGEPMDKAGAYAIQGKGHTLIAKIEGDVDAVIGLPLTPIKKWLNLI